MGVEVAGARAVGAMGGVLFSMGGETCFSKENRMGWPLAIPRKGALGTLGALR